MKICLTVFFIVSCLGISNGQDKLQLLLRSENLLTEGDTTKAINSFETILKSYPKSYTACLRLAEVYTELQNYQKAVQYCNIAIDITEGYITDSRFDLEKNGHLLLSDAKDELTNKLKVYEANQGDSHHLKGLIRIKQDRWSDAQFEFRRALALNPDNSNIKIDLSLLLMDLGKIDEAKDLVKRAIIDDSLSVKPYFNLANLYYKVQQFDSAFLYYNKASQIKPDFKWPYLYQGYIHTKKQEYESALESYNSYLQLDSLSEEVYYRRAVLLVELGQWDSAIDDWSKVISLNSDNEEAWRSRGLTHFQLKEYSKAIDDFNHALSLSPDQPYTIINRGYSYYLANEPKKALDDLNIGVKEMPKYYFGYYFRALVHLQLRKKKLACEDLSKALSLGMKETDVDTLLIKKCRKH